MKTINWRVRLKNKNFWITFIPAMLMLVQVVLSIFGYSFEVEKVQGKLLWADVLEEKGYEFAYIDSCTHVTPYGTSGNWLEETFGEINEKYIIEDQPDIK